MVAVVVDLDGVRQALLRGDGGRDRRALAQYAALYELTPLRLDPHDWWVWVLLFFADDFSYYWFHRVSHESRVFYKGEPLGLVQQMGVAVELVPADAGKMVPQTILTLRVLVQDLALGTFDSAALAAKSKEPVQGELPLGDKKV